MLGSFLFYCILLCPRIALPAMSRFSAPTDFCENLTYERMARTKSSKITMKMHMFHVKKPRALRISDRYLYNKCIQGDSLFIQYDEIPGTPCLPPLTLGFCCVFPQKINSQYFLVCFTNLISFQQFSL